jgi:iron(III) transport system substrate-binding protein
MKVSLFVIAVLIMAIGNAWAQSAPPKTPTELAKYMAADRERVLYEGAKKETKLVWYTSLTIYKEMAKFFEARYPGVTVDVYRATAVNLVSRLLSEGQSKRYIADVIETTPGSLMLVRDNKLLLPYNSPHLASYPEGSKDKAPGGLFYAGVDRESYAGIGYNKNSIPPADVPKSWDDLLKPSLKGKIGISNEEIATRVVGAMLKEKGDGFIKKLSGQEIKQYGLPALGLNELIVSGEVPLTFSAVDSNVRMAAGRGAPINWIPGDIVPANAGNIGAFLHTPHPHAALLFIDFMIGPEGQKLFSEKYGYGSPRKELGFKRWYPEQGLSSYDYANIIEKWNKVLLQISHK